MSRHPDFCLGETYLNPWLTLRCAEPVFNKGVLPTTWMFVALAVCCFLVAILDDSTPPPLVPLAGIKQLNATPTQARTLERAPASSSIRCSERSSCGLDYVPRRRMVLDLCAVIMLIGQSSVAVCLSIVNATLQEARSSPQGVKTNPLNHHLWKSSPHRPSYSLPTYRSGHC